MKSEMLIYIYMWGFFYPSDVSSMYIELLTGCCV